ncbi:glycosyltransferase [Mycobacterium sp. TNTM28]|uniref:Glycosyltransferase n=1 Tax=[Mycobacterium] fortunisiensis TaxID=2600579 RepID=A0ABS6KMP1_9MYCO|nr:glycosyltransferase [[Mycobacterium] fortunisiensis]
MPALGLSIVICCFTSLRRAQLTDAVASALSQRAPGDQVIVVVDHNDVLHADLRATLDDEVVLTTNGFQRGLSGARNTGIELARGDVVVFLDDDARLQPGALDAVRQAFVDETVVSIGGAVEACWQTGAAPNWFPAEFGWVIGCDYRGLPAHGAPIRNPIGAAMAVRHDALIRIDGFSTRLGRVGHLPAGCEETLMGVLLHQQYPGCRIIRDTDFRVTHEVSAERATGRYFARRCYQEGRSKAALTRMSGQRAALSSERSYTARVLTTGLWHSRRNPVRALALIGGFALTTTGFVVGLLQSVTSESPAAARQACA